jgi:hypothetical protein
MPLSIFAFPGSPFQKYKRRGVFQPDYLSDAGGFYDFDRLPSLADAIARSRSQHSRHLSAAT